jgi:hypothetical protein
MRALVKPLGMLSMMGTLAFVAVPELVRPHGSLLRAVDWTCRTGGIAMVTALPAQSAPGMVPPRSAYRIVLRRSGANPEDVALINTVRAAGLDRRDRLTLRLWSRSPTRNAIRLQLQQSAPPYGIFWERTIVASTSWKEFRFRFRAPKARPGQVRLALCFAESPGSIDISGVRLER